MSTTDRTSPTPSARTALDNVPAGSLLQSVRDVADLVVAVVRAVAFWAAALFPLTYLPAFLTGTTANHPLLIGGLVLVHVATLVVGRRHGLDADA
ncbi:hypothetical protein [Halobaculum limi]|uniref:hypothetical protein n=1 Tax=Halobaculum limi TaxID=3031916 RepID=UPI0024073920|nr:hypothetical protein [Halobaculum sp. YSMS11]